MVALQTVFRLGLVLVLLLAGVGVTHAEFSKTERNVVDTAEVLRDGEKRLGLMRWDYGVTERLQLGTYTLPYLAAAIPEVGPIVNLSGKYRLYRSDDKGWVISTTIALFTAPSAKTGDFQLTHFYLHSTWHWETLSLSTTAGVTKFIGDVPQFDLGGTPVDIAGNAAFGQFHTQLEWRRSATFAWLFEGRWSVNDSVSAENETRFQTPDGRTRVRLRGSATAEKFDKRQQVSASAMWSWDTVNLRLGLVSGDLHLPAIKVLIPADGATPVIDFYLRF